MQSIGEVVNLRFLPIIFWADCGVDDNVPPTQEGIRWVHHPLLASSVRSLFTGIRYSGVLTLRR